jgi:hypothetical protein
MTRVLKCTFPFPDQTPPVQASHACEGCPNADRAVLDRHARLKKDNSELVGALRSFAEWFFAPDTAPNVIDEYVHYGVDLYTRKDHTGTCVPKTIVFAFYKATQFTVYTPEVSESARAAWNGQPVASWPDGVVRSGRTWNELFANYTASYD